MRVCISGQGHVNKITAIAINSKNVKNLLLQNQKAYDFETWYYEASGNGALQSLYNSWSLDGLDLSYGKVNLGSPRI